MRPRPTRLLTNRVGVVLLGLVIISGCATMPKSNYISFTDFKTYSEYKKVGMTKQLIQNNKIVMSNTIR